MLKLIMSIAALSVVVPLVTGLRNYNRFGGDRKAITIYVILSAIVGLSSYVLWLRKMNNLPLLHVFTIIEFACISYIYGMHLKSVVAGKVMLMIVAGFTALSMFNSIYIQSLQEFNSYARGIEFLLVLFYSICYIYLLSLDEDSIPLSQQPMFWFNAGVLLYFTGTFFLYLLSNNIVLTMSRNINQLTWAFHGILLMLYHGFITAALWIRRRA